MKKKLFLLFALVLSGLSIWAASNLNLLESLQTLVDKSTAVQTSPMNKGVKDALVAETKNATDYLELSKDKQTDEVTLARISFLSSKLEVAETSVDVYESINTTMEGYNTESEDLKGKGIEVWKAEYDVIKGKYNSGDYSTKGEAVTNLDAALTAAIKADINGKIAEAKGLLGDKMYSGVRTSLEDAIAGAEEYVKGSVNMDGRKTQWNALSTKIEDAEASIDVYTKILAAINDYRNKEGLDKTGKNYLNGECDRIKGRYDNGEYKTLAEAEEELETAYDYANGLDTKIDELVTEIENAKGRIPTVNVGTGIFQYDGNKVAEYNTEIGTAQKLVDDGTAKTIEEIEAQINAMKAITAPSLNQPTVSVPAKFRFVKEKGAYNGRYITADANYDIRLVQDGGYQVWTLTKSNENDTYTLSVEVQGKEAYMCKGRDEAYLSFTYSKSEAISVNIVPSTTAGIYKLTIGENVIGCENDKLYVKQGAEKDLDHDFAIELQSITTDKEEVKTNLYGTVCMPYAFTISGAKVATVNKISEDGTIVLSEVTTEGVAGVAYVITRTDDETDDVKIVTDYTRQMVSEPVIGGYLQGVFEETYAPAYSYVLQKNNGVVGFYKVAEENTIKVPANHCYLNTNVNVLGPGARDFYGFDTNTDSETAVEAIEALTSGETEIYDLSGRRLERLQKGMNIVNGKKVLVK